MIFSVVVPVYNSEKTIKNAIESVLHQTFASFELLLVDDCSADSSGRICDFFAERDSRVKVVHCNKNGFVGKARNIGARRAVGEYLYFLDSDDVLADERVFSRAFEAIKENKPDVLSSCVRATDRGRTSGKIKDIADLFLFSPYLGQSFYKRRILSTPFSEERKTAEDCEWLFFNLQNAASLLSVPFPFYIYTVGREGSLTTSFRRELIAPTIDTWIRLYESESAFPKKKRIKRYCADALIEHAIRASKAGNEEYVKKCLPYLKKSKIAPLMRLRFLLGTKRTLALVNLKMKKGLSETTS